ncbi:hypothetical protein [Gillisia sp. CAL575]|uniref:hypothetical protein n=1 Tax=Gillisia sp. CAL575 TaxID=985255 RepID=UPI0003A16096|nr:hypothetical protein [Gillisia sp. CAL575]
MKKIIKILSFLSILFSTSLNFAQEVEEQLKLIESESYNLYVPDTTEALLILFGGFPETAVDIETEYPITRMALDRNIAVAYSNFNRKIWLEDVEKVQLANSINEMITANNLPSENIYIGGLSSGGNMALLLGNFLTENPAYNINPSGIFVVDSPIDLAALYDVVEQNIEKNFSESAVGESTFIFNYFNDQLGDPDLEIAPYEKYSTFTYETKNFQNLKALKNTKLRFYTEPDKVWWKENMGVDYEQMNAFHIKRLSEFLNSNNFKKVEYIPTKNKGYRANAERNPHSWSIVDKENLIQWILEK